MVTNQPQDSASDVSAEHGEVLVDGPDNVAVSLTPAAARETASRLMEKGDEASAQSSGAAGEPVGGDPGSAPRR
ncbi:hypothetical protein [uncultured Sphingomonas sp.]|uniref:hypothetical protein n=1 Tax=uncultured Sphingomonas sp. TaxID=158754 RepID=UPI0025DC772E|nr:hypothetical protein [uncultured Sphingomonas sp.]